VLKIFNDKKSLSKVAADHAAAAIREAISVNGGARIVLATGAAQFDFLEFLVHEPGIDWTKVEAFHLDEYIGLPITHPASFRKILQEHIVQKAGIGKFHALDGDQNPAEVVTRLSKEITTAPIDIAFVGIGENGHLAFNDPPADFETEEPFIIVNLDEACRRQQVGEGWFNDISEVPTQAISMSVRQVLKAKEIIAVVPDARKARAVKACLEGEVSPMAPSSILRTHSETTIYLDRDSAALLTEALETSA
jgi:glucosamine-6-phosphate deaminase